MDPGFRRGDDIPTRFPASPLPRLFHFERLAPPVHPHDRQPRHAQQHPARGAARRRRPGCRCRRWRRPPPRASPGPSRRGRSRRAWIPTASPCSSSSPCRSPAPQSGRPRRAPGPALPGRGTAAGGCVRAAPSSPCTDRAAVPAAPRRPTPPTEPPRQTTRSVSARARAGSGGGAAARSGAPRSSGRPRAGRTRGPPGAARPSGWRRARG